VIIGAYAAFAASVVVSGYAAYGAPALIIALAVVSALALAAALGPFTRARHAGERKPGSGPDQGSGRYDTPAAAPRVSANGHKPPGGPALAVSLRAAARRESLLPGWSIRRLWALSFLLAALVAAVDVAAGHRLILIGLLITGPCTALLTGRWLPTALAGAWACGLAVLLGVPDGIWATATHLAFISAVGAVAAVATAAAALISHFRS
jgi:hypothetical protein